jgi:hypothetical protein
MCALFGYAGYAAPRGPVKTKKKQDSSSFHTYTAYTAARASVEMKKKQDISSFPTYAEKGGPLDKKNIFWIKKIFFPKSPQISPRIGSKDQKLF